MIAVSGGWLLSRCFFAIWPRRELRLMSFLGLESSFCASYAWIKALAMSAHALMYRSFSGGSFSFLPTLTLVRAGKVIVSDAILRDVQKGDSNFCSSSCELRHTV